MAEAKKLPQYIASISICIGAMAAGTLLGWTGTISDKLKDGELNDLKLTDNDFNWIGSLMTLGAMLSCVPIGFMLDGIGRKLSVLVLVLPFLIGWALIIFAQHVGMIYAGRFVCGLAGGAFCVAAPMYSCEVAEVSIRGRLGTFFQLFLTIGILLVYVLGVMFSPLLQSIVVAVIPIVFGIVFFFQPETPFYCLKKGDREKALNSMKKLRGAEYDSSAEIASMQEQVDQDRAKQGKFWTFMKMKHSIKSFLICCALMVYQQLSGINAVIFYTSDIFKEGSALDSGWSSILVGVIQVVATLGASYFIEKTGRKILLMISNAVMAFALFLLAIFYTMKDKELVSEESVETMGFFPVFSVCLFIIAFSVGAGPIPWMMAAELLGPEIQSVCTSAAAVLNWFLAFVVTLGYHPISKAIGRDITFYIFSGITLSGVFFVLFVMFETKGLTKQEIQAKLKGE